MDSRAGRRVHGRSRKFLEGVVGELLDYAENEFRLGRRGEDGATLRDHTQSAGRQWQQLGRKPKVAPTVSEAPAFPDLLAYLWAWFQEILDGVSGNGIAPATIGWGDIAAWCALTGETLEPWEVRAVVRLGLLRAKVISEAKPSDRQDKG